MIKTTLVDLASIQFSDIRFDLVPWKDASLPEARLYNLRIAKHLLYSLECDLVHHFVLVQLLTSICWISMPVM